MSCRHRIDYVQQKCVHCGSTVAEIERLYADSLRIEAELKAKKEKAWQDEVDASTGEDPYEYHLRREAERKAERKRLVGDITDSEVERYSAAVDRLPPRGKAELLRLVRYLTQWSGRWDRTFGNAGGDEELDARLSEANEWLYDFGEIGFETYT